MVINGAIQFKTPSSRGKGDGVILFENGEFVVRNKGIATILFGAVGAALAKGKEVMRFPVSEIASYETSKKMLAHNMRFTLKDGSFVQFVYPKDMEQELIQIIASVPHSA